MIRGERLIKPGNSWFSPKAIEVASYRITDGGRALFRFWGLSRPTNPMQTPNTIKLWTMGNTLWVIRSMVERERAQTVS